MSAGDIDTLLQLWGQSHQDCGCPSPFQTHRDAYKKIDSIKVGDVPWKSFTLKYDGDLPASDVPPWMKSEYQIWYRDPRLVIQNMFLNPEFKDGMDYAPYIKTDPSSGRIFHDFMSGEWAWEKAVSFSCLPLQYSMFSAVQDQLQKIPEANGATLVPVLLGSDKTTTSVATGDNEYYPLYISIGNVHNNVRRAHRDAVEVIAFLAVSKSG